MHELIKTWSTFEKKVLNKAHGDLIKETTDKIEYLVEKLDAVRHEEAVANATQG